jgi:hypothetical protein
MSFQPGHPSRRDRRSGAIRSAGLAVAALTAGAVFALGLLILPPIAPETPIAPPTPVPPPPAPTPPPPPEPPATPTVDGATAPAPAKPDAEVDVTPEAPKRAAEAQQTRVPKPRAPVEEAPPSTPAPKPKSPPPDAAAAEKGEPAAPHEKVADKEVARDAWRKNLPDISAEAGKSAILIPIKGSTEGSTYHVTTKPRSVLISLPKGESMITMPFYNIRHDGFRQLWIKKDDATGVSTLRVVLGEASDPQVEIKDEFVRITVRRPVDASTGAAAPAHGPAGTASPHGPAGTPDATAGPAAAAPAPATPPPPVPATPPPARD